MRDPRVMQAEGHKHTVIFFAIQTVEWMKSLAADWTRIITFTRLSRVHTSARARSLVVGFHAGGHYLLS